ncbi:MAG: protein kinase domain-containing protein, partial [Dehalococcoidia bacterium]
MPSERVQRQIDRLLDEAEQAITTGDWETVRLRAEAVLRLDRENADAVAYLDAATQAPSSAAATPSAPPAPLPASFGSGRYAVLSLLGEGGRKVVYRARDAVLKREVAFALIKTEGLDDAGRLRVRREAELLAQLGTHANVVTIFELGEDDGRPYLVSEFLPGGDLARLIADAPDHRLPLARVLELATAIAKGLAYAHAHGVVHRDLKPGNIWLSDDGTPKLGDFGLAVAGGDARLTQLGMLVGTAAYLPPEQALGQEPTPRADLYALGCVLYELVTGRPPFLSDDPTAVITQHLTTPPVAPSWLSDSCPRDLETLILQLLAKRPEQRPASAAVVLEALGRIDPGQRPATHSQAGSNPLERLARGVFVGREPELGRLRQAFDAAVAGQGSVVLLVGEPGIGKTRAAQELETYARLRGAQVLWGASHEASGAPAYWPWIQVGRQWASSSDPGRLVAELGSAITDLARLFPDLARLPGVPAASPIVDAESAQFALFDAFVQFLRVASAETPLVVALDDLHWADKPALQLLQHLARELGRLRLLLVGTYRDTELARTHPLAETLAALNRGDGFTRIVLRGLAKDEVASYVRSAAGVEPSAALTEKLYEETEGNPFFLSEVVNLLTQEGTLTAERVSDIRVPDGVREALGRRLDRISAETTALLQVAAIIGREFSYDTLTLLDDKREPDEEQLLRQIEEAVAARVIEELPRAGRYRFTHALMQETLLSELSTTRKVRLHGQVGEALERRWGARAEERASRLAQHFSEAATLSARHAGKAVRYGKLAAQQAEAATAWAEAARQYERCLALVSEADDRLGEDEAALYTAAGRCCRNAGDYRPAWRNLMRAITVCRGRGDGAGMARATLEAVSIEASPQRLIRLSEDAIAALGGGDPYLEARVLVERANTEALISDDGDAEALARAAALARTHGYADIAAAVLGAEGFQLVQHAMDFAEASSRLRESARALFEIGWPARAAFILRAFVATVYTSGDLDAATSLATDALAQVRRVHMPRYEYDLLLDLANTSLARGDIAGFDARLAEAAEDYYGYLDLRRAERAALAGNREQALALLPESARAGGVPQLAANLHAGRAWVRLHLGDEAGARAELERCLELLQQLLRRPFSILRSIVLAELDEALPILGDDATVHNLYAEVAAWTPVRYHHMSGRGADRMAGALALRLGLIDEAEAHYRTGLSWSERERLPVEQGRCLQGLAEIVHRRGDDASAAELLDRAAALFEQHEAPFYLQQAQAAKAAIGQDAGKAGEVAANDARDDAPRPNLKEHAALPILGELATEQQSAAQRGAYSDA